MGVYGDPLEVGYIMVKSFQDIPCALPLIIPRELGAFSFEIMQFGILKGFSKFMHRIMSPDSASQFHLLLSSLVACCYGIGIFFLINSREIPRVGICE